MVEQEARVPRVVVGVDGSENSLGALRWAAAEARLRQAELWMVHAYAYPVPIAWHTVTILPRNDCCDEAALAMLEQIEFDQLDTHPGLLLRRVAVLGLAQDVLVETSVGANLLVIGARQHHSLLETVTGSVGAGVIRHARCPVVVVHAGDPDAAALAGHGEVAVLGQSGDRGGTRDHHVAS